VLGERPLSRNCLCRGAEHVQNENAYRLKVFRMAPKPRTGKKRGATTKRKQKKEDKNKKVEVGCRWHCLRDTVATFESTPRIYREMIIF